METTIVTFDRPERLAFSVTGKAVDVAASFRLNSHEAETRTHPRRVERRDRDRTDPERAACSVRTAENQQLIVTSLLTVT